MPIPGWSDGTPLHYQVREHMLNRVLRGDWPPGLAIPSEFDLVAEYQVSRPTIREAIRALRNEGYLVARKGAGTFVRKTLHEEPVVLTEDGLTASAQSTGSWTRREIRREVRPVGAVVDDILNIGGIRCFQRSRLGGAQQPGKRKDGGQHKERIDSHEIEFRSLVPIHRVTCQPPARLSKFSTSVLTFSGPPADTWRRRSLRRRRARRRCRSAAS